MKFKKEFIAAVIIFATVSVLLFFRSLIFDHALSSDQTFFQLVYLAKTNPAYADYYVQALNSYIPFRLTTYLREWIQDPIKVYQALLPFLIFFYLCSFSFVLQKVFKKWWISILIPLLSLIPRAALASQYWGIIGIGHATHRAFLQPFIPLFFYGFYRYQDQFKKLAFLFLIFGGVSALYPTQAFYFVAIVLLVYWVRKGWHWKTLGQVMGLVGFFLVGTLFYILPSLTIGLNIDPLDPTLVQKFNEALRYRFAYTFYPASLYTYTRSIILDSFFLVLIYWMINRWKNRLPQEQKDLLKFSNQFLWVTLWVTFGFPLIQDILSYFGGTRLFIFDQFGESKFVYLVLYIGLALFCDQWMLASWNKLKKKKIILGFGLGVISITNLFCLYWVIEKVYPLTQNPVVQEEFQEVCGWIKSNTGEKEIILAEDFGLRLCSERKLWVTWKEGMVYLYAKSPEEFVNWYERLREQEEIYKNQNIEEIKLLVKKTGISFVVIDRDKWTQDLGGEKILFLNNKYLIIGF